jgi:signal transduction histidine kinase
MTDGAGHAAASVPRDREGRSAEEEGMREAAIDEAERTEASALAVPQVLVVDDEKTVADEVAAGLRSLGFVVRYVTSPQQALAVLRDDPGVTVLVSDIRMPGCSGLELAHAALDGRADKDALSVVLITANANIADALEALRQGVSDFVRKPFRRDEIGKAVLRAHQHAIERRRSAHLRTAMQARIAAMVNENAALSARLLLADDAQSEIEKSLTDALTSRTQFLSLVSHELRTPLVPIIGFSELLASGSITDVAQVREYASTIHEAGRSQLRLIDNILLLTQLSAGELMSLPEDLDPSAIIAAALAEFPGAAGQCLIVNCTAQETRLGVMADRRQASQALAQLITNALRYATPASPVEITVHGTERNVRIDVTDRGPGIPQHMEAALGMPFMQGEMSRSRSHGGLGLGLAIAARLAAIQGGSLAIAPRPTGGTVASLVLLRSP